MNSQELANKIKDLLDSKKAINLEVIDISEKSTLADYFVLATGTSSTHVKALADEVEAKLEEEKIFPLNYEGRLSNSWIALDYKDVIVHIFSE